MNPITDVNVHLSRWPTRRTAQDETAALVAKLKSHGITTAWAGSFDGLLHKDLAAVNQRLTGECQRVDEVKLLPVGTINPQLPAWEDDLQRCIKQHRMHAIRLYPNYHDYLLSDGACIELFRSAAAAGLIVGICVQMEDQRTMHRLLQVKPVDLKPLEAVLNELPNLKVVIHNANQSMLGQIARLTRIGRVYADLSMLDGLACVERAIAELTLPRLLFGSHTPLLYCESAVLKLKESWLTQAATRAIEYENAQALRD